jgi:hypothetical protein
MEIRIRATGQVLLDHEWIKWVAKTYGKSVGPLSPEAIEMFDSDPVFEGPQATGGTVYQYSMRQGVEQQADGKWYTKYVLGPIFTDTEDATAAEQEAGYKARKDAEQATAVRADRNKRLAETDWTVIKALESNTPQNFDMAAYRQALRDITSQAGFPWNVQWPTKPE